jgi:hypothetical protein
MPKRKAPPRSSPNPRTPQTTGTGSPNPAALAASVMRTLIPAGGPISGGDATQIKSETGKKARGKR